jgi:hypothetical protein
VQSGWEMLNVILGSLLKYMTQHAPSLQIITGKAISRKSFALPDHRLPVSLPNATTITEVNTN